MEPLCKSNTLSPQYPRCVSLVNFDSTKTITVSETRPPKATLQRVCLKAEAKTGATITMTPPTLPTPKNKQKTNKRTDKQQRQQQNSKSSNARNKTKIVLALAGREGGPKTSENKQTNKTTTATTHYTRHHQRQQQQRTAVKFKGSKLLNRAAISALFMNRAEKHSGRPPGIWPRPWLRCGAVWPARVRH